MASQDSQNGADFFKTLSHRLKSENVTFSPPNENGLTILLYLRVEGIASEVHGHMEQMV